MKSTSARHTEITTLPVCASGADAVTDSSGVAHKYCSRCRDTKPVSLFGRNRSHRDGHANYCRECARDYARGRWVPKPRKVWPPPDLVGPYKCTRCGVVKPRDAFAPSTEQRSGVTSRCRGCLRDAGRRYYHSSPEARDKIRVASRKNQLLRKYGISPEDYDAIFRAQGGVCAICKKPQIKQKLLCVDHDHATNRRRDLLCTPCNVALGFVNDDRSVLAAMIDYIARHSGENPNAEVQGDVRPVSGRQSDCA